MTAATVCTYPDNDILRHGRYELVVIDHAVGQVAVLFVIPRVGVALAILRERSRHAAELDVQPTSHLQHASDHIL